MNGKGLISVDSKDILVLSHLKSFVAEDNLLEDFSALGQIESMQNLNLACNNIKTLPSLSSGLFCRLQVLDLSFNFIPVADIFSNNSDWAWLPSLRQLDLSGNQLWFLPDVLGSFPSLTRLCLDCNELCGEALIPLGGLPCLQYLGLSDNRVSDVPLDVTKATLFCCLTMLDLSSNEIR